MAEASPEIPVAESPADADPKAQTDKQAARTLWLRRVAIAVVVVAAAWLLYYLLVGRNYESTDNAYVNAEMAQVTPQISATVLEVRVKDTQAVKRGDVLIVLDPKTPRILVAQAQADLAAAQRRFRQSVSTNSALAAVVNARGADIAQAQAQVSAAQADYETARIDLGRRQRLAQSGAVSGEELSNATKSFAGARAALARAQAGVAQAQSTRLSAQGELEANQALVRGSTQDTDPAVLAAKARLDQAQIDLGNTVIRAPIDGVVTQRQIQIGQRVALGKSVMSIVPVGKVYIDANFKERQLRRVRVGMPAEVTADIYGSGVTYHGKIAGISGGTGASMSLIPAQNATGNWIKVVQRLPVRIELDAGELKAHPLRVGLSTEVEIHLND